MHLRMAVRSAGRSVLECMSATRSATLSIGLAFQALPFVFHLVWSADFLTFSRMFLTRVAPSKPFSSYTLIGGGIVGRFAKPAGGPVVKFFCCQNVSFRMLNIGSLCSYSCE
jgi:hypothetical protein